MNINDFFLKLKLKRNKSNEKINKYINNRIEGGIGTVLKFWPIKCFRPCPNFIENGGLYQRAGQGLNEIAFGRDTKYGDDYDDYEY